ncbi:MAG: DUF4234 domain-containing protein [Lachnospiraceae bacterium]|nr:DUF4234 domain-containing protein [Lachnospiraceae bacterium]
MVQQRKVGICVLLSLVTFGIYAIYWFICLTNDTNTVTKTDGTSGGMALLLTFVTCGIYCFYWMYKQGEKLDQAKAAQGLPSGNSGVLYLVLTFLGLGIVSYALMQDSINKLA